MPTDNNGERDNADRPIRLEPPKNGTICRIVEFPPDALWKNNASGNEGFESIGAGHAVDEGNADPMMHVTATTDYAIVLEGEIWAIMEEEETCLKAGDVLIQRGTMHSWSVRTAESARVAFILVDAKPLAHQNDH
ncbi:MAG: cupin domain-containing protein [Pseudomonadota bacterium]